MRKLKPDQTGRIETSHLAGVPRHPVRVVVENVRSAYNVGSILRTCDALLVERVYLAGFTADGHHPGVHKAALGAQDSVPWESWPGAREAVDACRADGCTIVALELTDSSSPVETFTRSDFPVCLVLGNEVDGVSDEVLSRCDRAVTLPQFGAKHSLNVAVAFGVAGYDFVRRWRMLDTGEGSVNRDDNHPGPS